MRICVQLLGLLCLLVATACADMPTQPDRPTYPGVPGDAAYNEAPQGCVSDGVCVLEPIVVDGGGGSDPGCDVWWTPSCGTCMMGTISGPDVQGTASCPGGGGSGGGTGGTGGGGTPGTPTVPGEETPTCPDYDPACDDEEPADDELVNCVDLGCQLRDPTDAEREKIMDLIDTLRTDGFCAEVRESALRMVNRQVQVWDNRVRYPETGTTLFGAAPWDYARGGQVMYIWTGALTAWTIAHEAIHGIWNPNGIGHWYSHTDITPAGLDLDATAGYCSGN